MSRLGREGTDSHAHSPTGRGHQGPLAPPPDLHGYREPQDTAVTSSCRCRASLVGGSNPGHRYDALPHRRPVVSPEPEDQPTGVNTQVIRGTDCVGLLPFDVIVCGSVAVNQQGVRLGKGAGYSDIEVAHMTTSGHSPR